MQADGGPGRGSGLEAEQAGVGPGAWSPSEPTVLKDLSSQNLVGRSWRGVAGAAGVVEQAIRGLLNLCKCTQPPHSPTPDQHS